MKNFKIVAGTSCFEFAHKLADILKISLTNVDLGVFPDNESWVRVVDDVHGDSIFVVQTIAGNPDHYLMQLMIIGDALKRSSASKITAVLPYYGYGRQDRRNKHCEPITARLIANLLESSGFDRVITMDLHTEQIEGFFNIPVDNLSPLNTFYDYLVDDGIDFNWVIAATDIGGIKRAYELAGLFGTRVATVVKERESSSEVKASALIGDVKGRKVLLIDDMCTTAGTLIEAGRVCGAAGAVEIRAVVTHALLVGDAHKKIKNSTIDKIYVSDTILGVEKNNIKNLQVVSVVGDFAKAIEKCL